MEKIDDTAETQDDSSRTVTIEKLESQKVSLEGEEDSETKALTPIWVQVFKGDLKDDSKTAPIPALVTFTSSNSQAAQKECRALFSHLTWAGGRHPLHLALEDQSREFTYASQENPQPEIPPSRPTIYSVFDEILKNQMMNENQFLSDDGLEMRIAGETKILPQSLTRSDGTSYLGQILPTFDETCPEWKASLVIFRNGKVELYNENQDDLCPIDVGRWHAKFGLGGVDIISFE